MIKNSEKLNKFYQILLRKEQLSYLEALAIYEMLHREAVGLGIISSENMLEGLDVDIRIAKILNAQGK